MKPYISQAAMRKAAKKSRQIDAVPARLKPWRERYRKPVDLTAVKPEFQKYLAKLNEGQRSE